MLVLGEVVVVDLELEFAGRVASVPPMNQSRRRSASVR